MEKPTMQDRFHNKIQTDCQQIHSEQMKPKSTFSK